MRFKRIYIEITNTCNLSCSFCIQNQRAPHALSKEEFQHILTEVRPFCNHIYLHVLGEPLSHPLLDDFLSMATNAGFIIHITTNGTLLKTKKDILLKHVVQQINVSLHSFPEHQQQDYLASVFEVCDALAQQGSYINYRLWNLQNQQLSAPIINILEQVLDHYACSIDEQMMLRLQRIPLQDHRSLHFDRVFQWPSLTHSLIGNKGRCLGMKDMCAILSDGRVVPCCLDSQGDIALGNIFETSFGQIIQSSKAEAMMRGFARMEVVETLCQHCDYRQRFTTAKKRG